jgi:phospholipid/cholesterol/gamma-HCH transport system substrate-binding protein
MRDNLAGAVWRFTIFVIVCVLALFALLAIFAQFRFQDARVYKAQFTNVSGLQAGDFVRIAGVEVGKVNDIDLQRDSTVTVAFSADPSVVLTAGSRAVIRFDNLIGGRYLALEEGTGKTERLDPGDTIPLARTAPALDLDALIGGFRPLFRALDAGQVNALSGQLIAAFQGQGATIASFLSQTASATNTLADRDQLIGQVINNLNTVLGSLAEHSDKFDKAVTSLSELVKGLAARKSDIATALAYENEVAATVSDLMSQARPPLKEVVAQTDRAAGLVLADHEYFDKILDTLPDKYRLLGRQGLYGDFFSFYLCDAVLKLNGKGGQPVYVKVAGQDTGRCASK